MNRRLFAGIVLPVAFLSACTQMHDWHYQTACNGNTARTALIRDLCRQFGENASVQLRDGDTTGCEQSALLPAALRMFVTSSAYTPHGTHPSVDVYFIPWSPTVQVNVQAEASAETEALANDVRGAIGQSLNKSNCPWTIDEQKFQELPKSG